MSHLLTWTKLTETYTTRKDLAKTSEINCTNLDKSLDNILQVNYKMESNEITAVFIEIRWELCYVAENHIEYWKSSKNSQTT